MIWPPSLVRVQFYENGRRRKNLWLPVLLIWPPVVLIAILLAPVVIPVLWLTSQRGRRRRAVMMGPALFRLFCATRGFSLEAGDSGNGLRVAID